MHNRFLTIILLVVWVSQMPIGVLSSETEPHRIGQAWKTMSHSVIAASPASQLGGGLRCSYWTLWFFQKICLDWLFTRPIDWLPGCGTSGFGADVGKVVGGSILSGFLGRRGRRQTRKLLPSIRQEVAKARQKTMRMKA